MPGENGRASYMDDNSESATAAPKPPQFWMMLVCVALLPVCYIAFQQLQPMHPRIAIIPGLGIFATLFGVTRFSRAYQRTLGPEQAAAADADALYYRQRSWSRFGAIGVGICVWWFAMHFRAQIPVLAAMSTQHLVWFVGVVVLVLVMVGEYCWRAMRRRQSGQ